MDSKKDVFMCKLPLVNYIIMGVMCAVMIPFAVVGVLRLAEVGGLYSYNPAVDIIVVVAEVAVTVFIALLTFLTRYEVTPTHFIFRRILPHKIEVERLLLLRHELSDNILVLYFADKAAPEGVRFMVLRVFDKRMPALVQAIQHVNHSVSYETFDASRHDND